MDTTNNNQNQNQAQSSGNATNVGAATGTAAPKHANALYVGDLADAVTEQILFDTFSTVGNVVSVRICRDINNNKSLGYGYVNYENAADAERALTELNFFNLQGRPCRVARSQPEPTRRKTGEGNLVVKGLNASVDDRAFLTFFSRFGLISSSKVRKDPEGKSKGYGFVHFENAADAQRALSECSGQSTELGTLTLEQYVPPQERERAKPPVTNLYVKNFPVAWTKEILTATFAKFGEVTSTHFTQDSKQRYFGFVNFATPEQAAAAHAGLDGHICLAEGGVKPKEDETEEEKSVLPLQDAPDRKDIVRTEAEEAAKIFRLFVSFAQPKAIRESTLKAKFGTTAEIAPQPQQTSSFALYVKNLPDDMTEQQLTDLFSGCGKVESAYIFSAVNSSGVKVSRGAGVVTMADRESATTALSTLQHHPLSNGKPLIVSPHEKKDNRRQRLEMEYARPHHGHPQHTNVPGGMHSGYGHQGFQGGYGMHHNMLMHRQGNFYQQPMRGHHARPHHQGNRGMMNMHNPHMMYMPAHQQMLRHPHHAVPAHHSQQPRIRDTIMGMPEQERKQTLGEIIYAKVAAPYPKEAPKITGMLVEMSIEELIAIVEDPALLQAKVQEALNVLADAQKSN